MVIILVKIAIRKMIRHKYNAKDVEINDIKFSSKKEGRYYSDLLIRKKSGEVLFWHRQPIFDLPGGIKYKADFQVFLKNGDIEYIDVKGFRTKEYIIKKKIVESIYAEFGIKIIEV